MWPFREELLGFFQTLQERANQRLFRVSPAWPSWWSILCWLEGSLSSFGHWRNTVSQKDPKYLNAHHPSSRKISKLDSLCLKREIQLKKARKVTGLRFSSLRIMISFKPCVHIYLVMSDSLRPYGLEPTWLLCPWDFTGKNTGAGCQFLLQEIPP